MANEKRSILWRLAADNDQAVKSMERFGDRGQAALNRVGNAVAPVNRSLLALDAAVGQARSGVDGLVGRAGSLGGVLGAVGAGGLAAAAGVGAAYLAWGRFVEVLANADVLAKAADRVGTTVEALQEYRFGAGLAGVATESLDKGFENLTRRIGEAIQGTGELAPIVKQYGIELRAVDGTARATADVFKDLAEAIAGTPDAAERARIAFGAFGRSGVELINFLSTGRDGVEEMSARARELGLVFSTDLARGAEGANDAMDELGQTIGARINQALLTLAPLAERGAKALTDLLVAARKFGEDENARAKAIYNAVNDPFPALRGLSPDQLEARRKALSGSVDTIRANPDAFRRQAALVSKSLEEVEEELTEEIREIGRRLDREASAALDLELDFPTGGAASPAATAEAQKRLDKLVQSIDQVAKVEAERKAAIVELDEVSKVLGHTEARRAELLATLNKHYDDKIERLNKASEATKAETKAEREAAREAEKLEQRKERLRLRVDQLASAWSRGEAAVITFRRQVDDLDEALRLGVIDHDEHTRRIRQATDEYRDATTALAGYADQIRAASQAGASLAVPQFDIRGLLQQSLSAFGSGGFSLRGLGLTGLARAGDFAIGNVLDGRSPFSGFNLLDKLTGIGDAISRGFANLAPDLGVSLANLFGVTSPLVSQASLGALGGAAGAASGAVGLIGAGVPVSQALAITGPLAGASPAVLASQGLAAGPLAAAGFSAALPIAGIALAGLGLILSKVLGKKSSGPALGATFDVDDGAATVRAVGADNGADVSGARSLADAVTQFTNTFLTSTGATLLPGAFRGELGYESKRYATAISSPGLTEGDRRSGRSPDLKSFGNGEGAAEAATTDFVVRSLADALNRGLVEGLSDTTEAVLGQVLRRLEEDGVDKLDDAGAAIDFATSFEDQVDRMNAAGDAAALQLLDLADGAEAFGKQQADMVKGFRENLDKFFGARDRTVAGSRPDPASASIAYDDDGNATGFTLGGDTFRRRIETDEGRVVADRYVSEASGQVIEGARNIAEAIERAADQVSAANPVTVTDFGEPGLGGQGMDALEAYIDNVLGLTDDLSRPLQGAALVLESGIQNIEAMREALVEFGLSSEDVTEKLTDATERFREKVRKDFNLGIAAQIQALQDPTAPAYRLLIENFQSLRDQAEKVGGDVGAVDRLFELQVAAQLREEEAAEIREAIAARQTETAVLERNVASLEELQRTVRNARADLRTDRNLSTLSPELRLQEAERQFDEALSAARGGDQDAARRALDLSRTVLELGRDFAASGPQYAALFEKVDGGLADLEDYTADQLSVAQDSLAELRLIREGLEDRLTELTEPAAERNYGNNPTRNRLLAALFPEFTGDFGQGAFGTFRAGVSSSDPRLAQAALIEQTVGYASGGDHVGGVRIVGERGPEMELTGPSRIFSAAETAAILRRARGGEGDAGGSPVLTSILRAVERQGAALAELARVLGQGLAIRGTPRTGFGGA